MDSAGHLEDIAVRDTRVSDAVDEPVRAMILDMLADDSRTAGEVHEALQRRGFDRTENTVRHHINELRDAGLVEVVRYEEGRGGTKKYYGANTMVLSYTLPDDADAAIEAMVDAVEPDVRALVDELHEQFGDEIAGISDEMSPCEHCRTQKYEAYVLLTVLRRAFVRSMRERQA